MLEAGKHVGIGESKTKCNTCGWGRAVSVRLGWEFIALALCVCISSLNVLADLPLQAVPSLLKLLDGAVLWELVRCGSHLTFCHAACEQLLLCKHRCMVS